MSKQLAISTFISVMTMAAFALYAAPASAGQAGRPEQALAPIVR